MVYPRCRLKKEKGGVPVISWMYRMVWESIWIFSFMVPVADGIRGKIYSQDPSNWFMAVCLLCGRPCGSDRRVPAAVYKTGVCAVFQF